MAVQYSFNGKKHHTFRDGEAYVEIKGLQDDPAIEIAKFKNDGPAGNGKILLCYAIRFLKEKGFKFETITLEAGPDMGRDTERFDVKSRKGDAVAKLERYYKTQYGFEENPDYGTMTASTATVLAHCSKGGTRKQKRRHRRKVLTKHNGRGNVPF